MTYSIENEKIRVVVAAMGAELQSLIDKHTGTEHMWSGDPKYWGKISPVLFPIVGSLKKDTYFFNHKNYHLSRHGFAREKEFILKEKSKSSLLFTLQHDESTLKIYPFEFEFSILYTLLNKGLRVTYIVENTGADAMCFSVGGHPAFKVPMFEGDNYSDYILEFEKRETAGRWPVSKYGLIKTSALPMLNYNNIITLKKELFHSDAIVLKHLRSDSVELISVKQNRGIRFDFPGFPYLGLWAAKNADFICIEPWCGIADSVDTNQSIINKEGINKLSAESFFERAWSVSLIEK